MSQKFSSGFTLIEMIVALLLSSLVLIGLIDISSNMVHRQFEGLRAGRVDSSTLLGLQQMYLEIEQATSINSPTQAQGNMIAAGCINYSATLAQQPSDPCGAIDTSQPITAFAYCVQNYCSSGNPNCVSGQGSYDLLYNSQVVVPNPQSSCPATTCPSIGCGGGSQTLIYQNVWLRPSSTPPYPYPFYLNQIVDGLDIHFNVGDPNPTLMQPTPVTYPIDTAILPDNGHFQ